jgi:hypothetical protein
MDFQEWQDKQDSEKIVEWGSTSREPDSPFEFHKSPFKELTIEQKWGRYSDYVHIESWNLNHKN